uniref:Uncharacterized protein n=1 Tax=Plectus sambesii TaxID=2011161 RepID=A0A914V7S3_9BILA
MVLGRAAVWRGARVERPHKWQSARGERPHKWRCCPSADPRPHRPTIRFMRRATLATVATIWRVWVPLQMARTENHSSPATQLDSIITNRPQSNLMPRQLQFAQRRDEGKLGKLLRGIVLRGAGGGGRNKLANRRETKRR